MFNEIFGRFLADMAEARAKSGEGSSRRQDAAA